jgi:hypothetical protein
MSADSVPEHFCTQHCQIDGPVVLVFASSVPAQADQEKRDRCPLNHSDMHSTGTPAMAAPNKTETGMNDFNPVTTSRRSPKIKNESRASTPRRLAPGAILLTERTLNSIR